MTSLPEHEQLAWLIALGEERGGKWDYKRGRWRVTPQPRAVLAIPAKMEG